MAELSVLAEAGNPLTFRGPVSALPCAQAGVPIVVRVTDSYQLAEVRMSDWASPSDARLAKDGIGGVFGIVPRSLTGQSEFYDDEPITPEATPRRWLVE